MISNTFLISLSALVILAVFGRLLIQLPKNIWLLFFAQPIGMASSSMIVFAGGILASNIAPSPEYATLPLTVMILGTALAVIPASLMAKKIGRKNSASLGYAIAILGSLTAAYSAYVESFYWLVFGALLMGASLAIVAQMRFAAIESVDLSLAPKAIAVLMVGGIFAAILGPEVAVSGKDWVKSSHGFVGSFLGLAFLQCIALVALRFMQPITIPKNKSDDLPRSLKSIVSQPLFIIAVLAGAIGYSVMSYVMTATPLSMHEVEGHSLESTKWVIQSHIIAMYLPSLFSAYLIRFLGIAKLMIIGSLAYLGVILITLSGHQVMHYWWALVLLGIGWNFLFTCGTLLLPQSYQPSERFKAQAFNDFSIFFVQAIGSLSAGMILFSQGWNTLIFSVIPIVIIMFITSTWYFLLQKSQPLKD